MERTILGITGELYAGKTTAAEFLTKRFGVKNLRFSKLLDEILMVLGIEKTRKSEQDLAEVLRKLYGEAVLARALLEDLDGKTDKVVIIDGIRKAEELDELRKNPNFCLIYVKASFENRFKRMKARQQKIGESDQTEDDLREAEKHNADEHLREFEDYADYIVENNGTVEEFENELTKCFMQSL
jgi:dephospho-CoA kinase